MLFVCVFFWVYTRAVYLTLCFSSIQESWFVQQPVVGPATRRFCRAFITSVSVCVSCGCLQSAVLEWKCWMCESVCTYEGIWQLFDLTSNAFCTRIGPQDCIYKHECTPTYMYRQTERHSGWISEIVAAHTLAHVLHTRTPLRCGWAVVGTCMHTCMCMHACLSLSFSLEKKWWKQSYLCFTNVYVCICFMLVHFYEHARELSGHTRAHMLR